MANRPRQLGLRVGNYPDFVTGQHGEFAVAFAQEELRRATRNDKWTWRLIAESTYEVCAKILHADRHGVSSRLRSVGVLQLPVAVPGHVLRPGDWVEGTADLSVTLSSTLLDSLTASGSRPSIYTWTIEVVLHQSPPWLFAKSGDLPGDDWAERAIAQRSLRIRDSSKNGWAAIPQTDAWDDEGGSADYLLRCRRALAPPKTGRSANFSSRPLTLQGLDGTPA